MFVGKRGAQGLEIDNMDRIRRGEAFNFVNFRAALWGD
jgi:hypothetical protein